MCEGALSTIITDEGNNLIRFVLKKVAQSVTVEKVSKRTKVLASKYILCIKVKVLMLLSGIF